MYIYTYIVAMHDLYESVRAVSLRECILSEYIVESIKQHVSHAFHSVHSEYPLDSAVPHVVGAGLLLRCIKLHRTRCCSQQLSHRSEPSGVRHPSVLSCLSLFCCISLCLWFNLTGPSRFSEIRLHNLSGCFCFMVLRKIWVAYRLFESSKYSTIILQTHKQRLWKHCGIVF